MKKRPTRAEKWLFITPLLMMVVGGAFWQWRQSAPLSFASPQSTEVTALEFSPDSRRLLAFFNDATFSRQIRRIYDLASHAKICDLVAPPSLVYAGRYSQMEDNYTLPSWSPDGESIVAASNPVFNANDKIAIWNADSCEVKADWIYKKATTMEDKGSISYSPDGKTLLGEGYPSARFDVSTGKRLNQQAVELNKKWRLRANESLGLLAMKSRGDKRFQVMDCKTNKVVWQPVVGLINAFGWCGDLLYVKHDSSKRFAAKGIENRLIIWNGKTHKTLYSPQVPSGSDIGGFCFQPGSDILMYVLRTPLNSSGLPDDIGEYSQELIAWDYRAKRILWHTGIIVDTERLQPSPDGKCVVVTGTLFDQTEQLSVYDMSGKQRYERSPIGTLSAWSPDSKKLAITTSEPNNIGKLIANNIEVIHIGD